MPSDESAARARLEEQRADLAQRIDRLQAAEHHETSASGNVAGKTDNAHEWENTEIREGQVSEALDELRRTEAALARMDDDDYGVCVALLAISSAGSVCPNPEAVRCEKHM